MSKQRIVLLVGVLLVLTTTGCGTATEQFAERRPVAAANLGQAAQATPTIRGTPGTSSRPLDCDMTISASYIQIDSVAALAWVSHQVIAGTVIQQLPSVWIYPDPRGAPSWRKIYTDYIVRVDQRLRGLPSDTIRVRHLGGMLDGCTQRDGTEPDLAVGDRRLLFLHDLRLSNAPAPTYAVIGGPQGYWGLNADGTITTTIANYRQFNGLPLNQLAGQIRVALTGPPPAATPRDLLVPLEQSPLSPVP